MKTYLKEFENIGKEYANQLQKQMKIRSIDDFEKFSLEEIHQQTKIDMERLKQWADVIDLYHIPDLTTREAELLYFANINSVQELSHRQAIRIFYKLREIDIETYHIILQLPTFQKIENWINFSKLMTKRIKFGQNIPIIMIPVVEFDHASELKNFKIFTVEDFVQKSPMISNLRKKIGMSRHNFHILENTIDFIKVEGIDLYFANLFLQVEIEGINDFLSLNNDEILQKVKEIQDNDENCPEKLTLKHIEEIKQKIMEQN
ncbi:hypothetical protein NEF87_002450 [Candidatus Lokiarchaeum ossiferum]|uniref:DUF4332 domain-containing protein n=1 Tax=Candidatus Lokiarchaeum ossiferum TaxID=2951803 RepID=A0ABY6HRN1_9ARCH|nr:hypothetical protein NEF87_002450 [Candidatus Lokiarchaeum sp. B-35]